MLTHASRLSLAASLALVVALISPAASVAGGGGLTAVRVEGAGIEEAFTLDSSDWINENAVLRLGSTQVEGAVAPIMRQQLEGRPRVDIMLFWPYALNCGDDFTMRRECANRIIEFYPAVGGEPAYLIGSIGPRADGLVWIPGPHALAALERLGIPTIHEPASISTEAQAGWVALAALVGCAFAGSLGLAARVAPRLARSLEGTR